MSDAKKRPPCTNTRRFLTIIDLLVKPKKLNAVRLQRDSGERFRRGLPRRIHQCCDLVARTLFGLRSILIFWGAAVKLQANRTASPVSVRLNQASTCESLIYEWRLWHIVGFCHLAPGPTPNGP
jgi:hypothetical protein